MARTERGSPMGGIVYGSPTWQEWAVWRGSTDPNCMPRVVVAPRALHVEQRIVAWLGRFRAAYWALRQDDWQDWPYRP